MDAAVTPAVEASLRSTVDLLLGFATDFFAFIIVVAAVAGFSLYFGRDRLVPLIAGLLAAIPLYSYFPFLRLLGENPALHIGLFVIFVIAALVAFSGLAGWVPAYSTGYFQQFALSVLAAGIVIAVAINLIPVSSVYTFSEPTRALFASSYLFYWLAAGIGGVFILGR